MQMTSTELVDRSIRVPVLFFFGSGVFWLVVASTFYLLSSWQIHAPSAWWAFPGVAWLSFGRAYPAFLNCYVYGWATCAGIGTGIWLLSRLNGVSLRSPLFPVIAGLVWNIGMISGLFSLLAGASTGRQLLEFPSYSAFILFLALAMISLWAMTIVCNRKRGTVSISEWYLVGAFLWFAWMYATANIALEIAPAPGVAQAAINWWYVGALVQLWLTPVALATAYYLIPVISGRPIYSYKLALLGFWGLALFGGWTGMTHVIGGPFPAWIVTASIVAKVLLMIPVFAVAANFHLTMKGHFGMLRDHLRAPLCCHRHGGLHGFQLGRERHFDPIDRPVHAVHIRHGDAKSAWPVWLLQHDPIWSPLLYRAQAPQQAVALP